MKILNLCFIDYAGLAFRLADAVNKCTRHKARLLTRWPHRFEYPTDIVTGDPYKIKKWVDWADIVNYLPTWRRLRFYTCNPEKLMWTHVGTSFRLNHHKFHVEARRLGLVELVSTPDIMYYKGLRWLPNAVPVDEWNKMKTRHTGKPIICQTPSGRRGKKTEIILNQIKHKENIRVRIVENKSWEECMRLKSTADLYVGEFNIGYGMSELEAMAMRIPVISRLKPENEESILRETGYMAHYDCPLEELSSGIDTILSDEKLYVKYADLGYRYVKEFHDYPVVSKKFTSYCSEVLHG